ncbi:MAG TPA: ParA family protein [Hyphomicrobiaceae bacterium]|nr:ParA family protein [Hyphomicrobiaceae bacterium]
MITIAIANLKGGVGKSTTTLFVAEHWALKGNKVLVIDLDPQANASFMLLSRRRVEQLEKDLRTVPHLFADVRNGVRRPALDYVCSHASDLTELAPENAHGGFVSVVPSIPRLWFDEYEFVQHCYEHRLEPVQERVRILREFLEELNGGYSHILFDCPPGFSTLTRSAVILADRIVAPTIADNTSVRSLRDFVNIGLRDTLGIQRRDLGPETSAKLKVVVSKFSQWNNQRAVLDGLRETYHVILPPIPLRDQVLSISENLQGQTRTYAQKYRRPVFSPLAPHVAGMSDALFGAI